MTATEKIKWMNKGIALAKLTDDINERTDALIEGTAKEIYCGDEDRAEFLMSALLELGYKGDFDVFTVDGEYFVEVNKK